jgi:hypothetical protein
VEPAWPPVDQPAQQPQLTRVERQIHEVVARAAGVGRVTLYAHFPSREQLLGAALDRALRHQPGGDPSAAGNSSATSPAGGRPACFLGEHHHVGLGQLGIGGQAQAGADVGGLICGERGEFHGRYR